MLSSTVNGQQSGTITISGMPTQSGTFTLTTTLQDGDGDTVTGTETLAITAPTPTTLPTQSNYPTNQPNYGVAPRNNRVPMTTKAERIAWRRLAAGLANEMRSFLKPGDGLRVTSP